MKRYLLIAGDRYYPQAGTDDWVGCFETREEAEAQVVLTKEHNQEHKAPIVRDWYVVVDLMEWVK